MHLDFNLLGPHTLLHYSNVKQTLFLRNYVLKDFEKTMILDTKIIIFDMFLFFHETDVFFNAKALFFIETIDLFTEKAHVSLKNLVF